MRRALAVLGVAAAVAGAWWAFRRFLRESWDDFDRVISSIGRGWD